MLTTDDDTKKLTDLRRR